MSMDINQIMDQARAMQSEMQKMQDKLGEIEVTGESGGGLVKLTITCRGEARKLDLDPSVIDVDDKETLEDLIVAAINEAKKKAEDTMTEETKKMMTKMGLPSDLSKLPF